MVDKIAVQVLGSGVPVRRKQGKPRRTPALSFARLRRTALVP